MTNTCSQHAIQLRIAIILFVYMFCATLSAEASTTYCYLTNHRTFPGDSPRTPLIVVAFGTSLTWGDGLKQKTSYRYLVASDLSQRTHRTVELWTFAHSAAYLTDASEAGSVAISKNPFNGALNGTAASVAPVDTQPQDGQADCAVGSPYSLQNADLIMVDGCINEVNAVLIVAPWSTADYIKTAAQKYCNNMVPVLQRLETIFPIAQIVVINYYPIVSTESTILGYSGTHHLADFAAKVLQPQMEKSFQDYKAKNVSREEEQSTMADNSELFYQTSKEAIAKAVDVVNSAGKTRAFAATLPETSVDADGLKTVDPYWAYGARDTHLFLLPISLFFGLAVNPDDNFVRRWWQCLFTYPFFSIDRLVNESNAGFHPNQIGAKTYKAAIESVVPNSIWNNK